MSDWRTDKQTFETLTLSTACFIWVVLTLLMSVVYVVWVVFHAGGWK